MAEFCRESGIRFGLVLLPGDPPIPVDRVSSGDAGYPVLDLGGRFEDLHRREYQNAYVGHLTPSANGLVAEDIKRFIESEDLLSPMRSTRAEASGGTD